MTSADILQWLQVVTEIVAGLPTPLQPEASLALQIEKIAFGALKVHASATGQTVDQIIAQLHKIEPIP